MRISDWSSDVCSSDLRAPHILATGVAERAVELPQFAAGHAVARRKGEARRERGVDAIDRDGRDQPVSDARHGRDDRIGVAAQRLAHFRYGGGERSFDDGEAWPEGIEYLVRGDELARRPQQVVPPFDAIAFEREEWQVAR